MNDSRQWCLCDFLRPSGFDDIKSEAVADIIADLSSTFATKHDLELLRADLKHEIELLRADVKRDSADLRGEMNALNADLRGEMNALKADLTWRFIALTAFLGTLLSLVNIYVA